MKNPIILGTRVDNLSHNEALKLIKQFVLSKIPHQICTVNPEYIMEARNDDELHYILNHSSINTPDGGGLLFASRFLGSPLKEKITGVDLVQSIFKMASKNKWKVFLLGGGKTYKNVAQKTADYARKEYPGIKIAGIFEGNPTIRPISKKIYNSGYQISKSLDMKVSKMLPKSNMEIIQKIASAKPHILLVAYGCPKQDKFIARYAQYLNVPVMIGVGGTFDYLSSEAKYAPRWIRVIHLEWLYRLFTQKGRFSRIVTAVIKFPLAVIFTKK